MSDVIEIELHKCPICGKPLNANSPDPINYNGQLIHRECVSQAEAQAGNGPGGFNPNNSYT